MFIHVRFCKFITGLFSDNLLFSWLARNIFCFDKKYLRVDSYFKNISKIVFFKIFILFGFIYQWLVYTQSAWDNKYFYKLLNLYEKLTRDNIVSIRYWVVFEYKSSECLTLVYYNITIHNCCAYLLDEKSKYYTCLIYHICRFIHLSFLGSAFNLYNHIKFLWSVFTYISNATIKEKGSYRYWSALFTLITPHKYINLSSEALS